MRSFSLAKQFVSPSFGDVKQAFSPSSLTRSYSSPSKASWNSALRIGILRLNEMVASYLGSHKNDI